MARSGKYAFAGDDLNRLDDALLQCSETVVRPGTGFRSLSFGRHNPEL
jgi:hypothetical protein